MDRDYEQPLDVAALARIALLSPAGAGLHRPGLDARQSFRRSVDRSRSLGS